MGLRLYWLIGPGVLISTLHLGVLLSGGAESGRSPCDLVRTTAVASTFSYSSARMLGWQDCVSRHVDIPWQEETS